MNPVDGPQPAVPTFHRPADVARTLDCSEWWVKEQARQRRIPYCWIGGSYRFTDQHITEIARLFEVRPGAPAGTAPIPRQRRPAEDEQLVPATRLRARTPRRTRNANQPAA